MSDSLQFFLAGFFATRRSEGRLQKGRRDRAIFGGVESVLGVNIFGGAEQYH